ncbi:hypothetical protein RUM43_003498 [Polyplax serrata]|uniref:Uncharacterized protein n=1 Tax=Polyplax serrata TaxID=468196 RepID=A0AAN8P3B1_POLSC
MGRYRKTGEVYANLFREPEKKEFDEKMRKKDETETGVVSVSGCETRTGAIESPFVLPSGLSSDCHPLAVAACVQAAYYE